MRNGFIFKGFESESFGIFVENPIEIPRAKIRHEEKTVIGSSKVLYIPEGDGIEDGLPALEPVTISVDCVIRAGYSIDEACAWLWGSGELIVCGDADHRRRAFVNNQIDLAKIIRARNDRRFTVDFRCEGWRYKRPAGEKITLNTGKVIQNPGTGAAEPLITVYGSGSGELMVGNRSMMIEGLNGEMHIDSDTRLAWVNDRLVTTQIMRIGGWPILPPGDCAVSWSGGITRVEIEPRWRDF